MTTYSRETKIDLTMKPKDAIKLMSEGNPGAMTAILLLLNTSPSGYFDVVRLDEMNMRGSQIWVAYKYHCKENINLFRKLIQSEDQAMIDEVNEKMAEENFPHVARKSR